MCGVVREGGMAREDGGGREGRWEGWSEGVRKGSMQGFIQKFWLGVGEIKCMLGEGGGGGSL